MLEEGLEERIESKESEEEGMYLGEFCVKFCLAMTDVRRKLQNKIFYLSEGRKTVVIPGEIVDQFKSCFIEGGPLFWNFDEDRSESTYSLTKVAKELNVTQLQLLYLIGEGISERLAPNLKNKVIEDNHVKIPSLNLPYDFLPRIPVAAVREWRKLNRNKIVDEINASLRAGYEKEQAEVGKKEKDIPVPDPNLQELPVYTPNNFNPVKGKKYFHCEYGVFTVLELQPPSKKFHNQQFSTLVAEFENRETRILAYNVELRKTIK